jgi:MraZ protein
LVVAGPRFISRFSNKIDRKGRVSVPAPYRQALAGQATLGIVCFPNIKHPCIEATPPDYLDGLIRRLDQLPEFSEERDALDGLFGRMHELPFDGEGRVMLPEELTTYAGITDLAVFVGRGATFQIWEPEKFKLRDAELLERARRQNATVPPLRAAAPGGT